MRYKVLTPDEIDRVIESGLHKKDPKIASQIIFSKARRDVNFFADFFLSHLKSDKKTKKKIKSSPSHLEVQKKMKEVQYYNCIIYRSYGKTTTSIIDTVHDIVYWLEPTTVLRCTDWLGKKFIKAIRNEFLYNKRILQYCGDYINDEDKKSMKTKRQTQKTIDFKNNCSVEYISRYQSSRWERATKLKVDDPQDEKDIGDPKKEEKMVRHFFSALFPLLGDDDGKCIVLGTILSPWCFVNVLATDDSRWFITDKYPAISDIVFEHKTKWEEFTRSDWSTWVGRGRKHIVGGTATRPERRPLSSLDNRLMSMWYDEFMQEYQHQPMETMGLKLIDSEIIESLTPMQPIEEDAYWIEWLNIFRRNDGTPISIGSDTSTGNGKDFATIVWRDNDYKLYFTYKGKSEPDDLADILNIIINEWGYVIKKKAIGIENNFTWGTTISRAKNEGYWWYWDIYIQRDLKTHEEKETKNIGWNTNGTTRPAAQSKYKKYVGNQVTEFDAREVNEMKTFILNGSKAEATEPFHDDLCMAGMICLMMCDTNTFEYIAG